MHYDIEKGVKVDNGLFSHRSVAVMFAGLILVGLYTVLCVFAPDIFKPTSTEKWQIDNVATTEKPTETGYLRIPTAGISVPVSQKNAAGSVYYSVQGLDSAVNLLADYKNVGITPAETIELSPLYRLGDTAVGDMIYLDFDGKRTAYRAAKILFNSADISRVDLAISAVVGNSSVSINRAAVRVEAAKVGEVVITDGKAEIAE